MLDEVSVAVWAQRGATWARIADLQTWRTYSLTPMFNRAGPWSLLLPWDVQTRDIAESHLLTFDFRGHRFTAAIDTPEPYIDDDGEPLLQLGGTDALSWVGDALGWANPALPLADQDSVRYYKTGPAEKVLRNFIKANLTDRLGYQIVYPDSQDRGATVTIDSAYENVLGIVSEKATLGGIGVRLGLVDVPDTSTQAQMTLEFYMPQDRSGLVEISPENGTLKTWRNTKTRPAATRALIQAARDKQTRQIASVNLTNNTITTAGEKKTKNREVQTVNVAANTITTKSVHEMPTGSLIQITSGTAPAPLQRDTDYYSIKVDSDTLRVAATRANAEAGNAIALTNNGAGQITVTKVWFRPTRHRLRTGDIIGFSGGTPPEPLESDVEYHAIRVDENTIKVAMTRAEAAKEIAVDLTNQPEGDVTIAEQTRRYRSVKRDAAETEWGRVKEVLVTASGEDDNDALDEQGQQLLKDNASESSFTMEVLEAEGMQAWTHFELGDLIAVEPLGGLKDENGEPVLRKVDYVGAIRMTAEPATGFSTEVIVGNPDNTDPAFKMAATIRALRRRVNKAEED